MANVLIDENILIGWADQIREKTGTSEKMRPSVLLEKTESLGSGGGSSDLVKYVTFMSEDGTQELYKMPVLSGDDCKDPVTHGDIDAPTKESTESIVFTHTGWSLEIGGEMDSSALADVTANRVVYAVFDEGVRYYTVNLWLAEGELFESVQVPYGGTAIPSEEPEKADHVFIGWEPSNENITADTDCYAQWLEHVTFANASWTTIDQIGQLGKASEMFSIGDEKELDLGEYGTVVVQIAGFNHDDLADGSGKAAISMICKTVAAGYTSSWINPSTTVSTAGPYYYNHYIHSQVTKMNNYLPDELWNVIKIVSKTRDNDRGRMNPSNMNFVGQNAKLWLPSLDELGFTMPTDTPYTYMGLGSKYELYPSAGGILSSNSAVDTIYDNEGNKAIYWTRNIARTGDNTPWTIPYINSDGTEAQWTGTYAQTQKLKIRFGFCV